MGLMMSSLSSTMTIPTIARITSIELVARGGKATQAPHTHSSPLEMLQRLETLFLFSLRLSKWSTLSLRNLWVVEEVEEEGDGEMGDEAEVEDVGVEEEGEHSILPSISPNLHSK